MAVMEVSSLQLKTNVPRINTPLCEILGSLNAMWNKSEQVFYCLSVPPAEQYTGELLDAGKIKIKAVGYSRYMKQRTMKICNSEYRLGWLIDPDKNTGFFVIDDTNRVWVDHKGIATYSLLKTDLYIPKSRIPNCHDILLYYNSSAQCYYTAGVWGWKKYENGVSTKLPKTVKIKVEEDFIESLSDYGEYAGWDIDEILDNSENNDEGDIVNISPDDNTGGKELSESKSNFIEKLFGVNFSELSSQAKTSIYIAIGATVIGVGTLLYFMFRKRK